MNVNKQFKVRIGEQDPAERIRNFKEVNIGYTLAEAQAEASRCLQCKHQPCVKDCPVNVDIPQFIRHILSGDIQSAYNVILENNSLPGVCGRVCPQEDQCQMNCVRGIKGDSVEIGNLERFVADNYQPQSVIPKPLTGGKVAVIGSGPAGLACAAQLLDFGVEVTVFEALHALGGVLRYGIPEFRLPDRIVDQEINLLVERGMKVETNAVIGQTWSLEELMDEYDSVFIGMGAGSPRMLNVPGENANGVLSANEFLTRINLMQAYRKESDTPVYVGKKVLVVGGGNVALDAARCARRLTDGEVTIVYRRGLAEMPARQAELEHTGEEEIRIMTQLAPLSVEAENGWVSAMNCVEMEKLDELDSSGRTKYRQKEGSNVRIEADTIIVAVGQNVNPMVANLAEGLELSRWNTVNVDENFETTIPGVYAGGDIVTGAATVISAIEAGKKAAHSIYARLQASRNQ